jgi:glycosyltransferase involved in cell wall biosynthesis
MAGLRVLHLNTERTWRGGERQTLQLARGLADRGHVSEVVVPPRSPLGVRAREAGLPVHELRMRGEADPVAVLDLATCLRRRRPDILHMHTSHAHTLGVLASCVSRIGRRIVSRRVDFSIHRHPLHTSAIKYRYGVHRYVTVSGAIRDVLVRDGVPAERIRVVPSGIDPARFDGIPPAPLREELSLPPGSRLVGDVAHFGWHKAQEVLVRAGRLLARTHPEAVLLLVGDGECRARVEEEARTLGLLGRSVRFLGFREDVPQLLAALDVFVMCSVMEGLCTSILDALASRRPVVASRVGGLPEILEGGRGILVPPSDPQALAAAIGRVLDDPALARELGERGRRTVEERFSVDATVEGTLAVYREVLGEDA